LTDGAAVVGAAPGTVSVLKAEPAVVGVTKGAEDVAAADEGVTKEDPLSCVLFFPLEQPAAITAIRMRMRFVMRRSNDTQSGAAGTGR
jgi:hypothetical protein